MKASPALETDFIQCSRGVFRLPSDEALSLADGTSSRFEAFTVSFCFSTPKFHPNSMPLSNTNMTWYSSRMSPSVRRSGTESTRRHMCALAFLVSITSTDLPIVPRYYLMLWPPFPWHPHHHLLLHLPSHCRQVNPGTWYSVFYFAYSYWWYEWCLRKEGETKAGSLELESSEVYRL